MAKLYFRFGAMGSSKTANALMTKFNYEEKGKFVWLIKPAIDTRDDAVVNGHRKAMISSRIGLSAEADAINTDTDILELWKEKQRQQNIDVIICDECQFLSEEQVTQLRDIASFSDIPVLCFGLRTDFTGRLFSGSKRLFEVADSIAEIKSICECGEKAIINARVDRDGSILYHGNTFLLGGNDRYKGMCWKCWRKRMTNIGPSKIPVPSF